MIVVEGFDCSGKSTLSKKIGEWTEMPVVHTGGPTKDENDVMSCLTRSVSRMFMRVVQDRCTHISESVYSMLTRPRCASMAMARSMDFTSLRLLVYCRPDDATILNALKNHQNKEYDTTERMKFLIKSAPALIRIYDTMIMHFGRYCHTYMYDWTKGDDSEIEKLVKEKLNHEHYLR